MTQPKMVPCEGSGQIVYGPDEPTGTVQCFKCGDSTLPMKTTIVAGKKQHSVPEHKCRANAFRRMGAKKAASYRRTPRRDSGRS